MMRNTVARFSRRVGLAVGLAGMFATASAFAAFADGSPVQMEYPGHLMIQLVLPPPGPPVGATNFDAQLSSPGCGIAANSIDTIKAWQSLAQGALLSGRKIRIYYTDCGTGHWITDVVLMQSP